MKKVLFSIAFLLGLSKMVFAAPIILDTGNGNARNHGFLGLHWVSCAPGGTCWTLNGDGNNRWIIYWLTAGPVRQDFQDGNINHIDQEMVNGELITTYYFND
jgi:hypothetical protein